jgi:hypothetical protein
MGAFIYDSNDIKNFTHGTWEQILNCKVDVVNNFAIDGYNALIMSSIRTLTPLNSLAKVEGSGTTRTVTITSEQFQSSDFSTTRFLTSFVYLHSPTNGYSLHPIIQVLDTDHVNIQTPSTFVNALDFQISIARIVYANLGGSAAYWNVSSRDIEHLDVRADIIQSELFAQALNDDQRLMSILFADNQYSPLPVNVSFYFGVSSTNIASYPSCLKPSVLDYSLYSKVVFFAQDGSSLIDGSNPKYPTTLAHAMDLAIASGISGIALMCFDGAAYSDDLIGSRALQNNISVIAEAATFTGNLEILNGTSFWRWKNTYSDAKTLTLNASSVLYVEAFWGFDFTNIDFKNITAYLRINSYEVFWYGATILNGANASLDITARSEMGALTWSNIGISGTLKLNVNKTYHNWYIKGVNVLGSVNYINYTTNFLDCLVCLNVLNYATGTLNLTGTTGSLCIGNNLTNNLITDMPPTFTLINSKTPIIDRPVYNNTGLARWFMVADQIDLAFSNVSLSVNSIASNNASEIAHKTVSSLTGWTYSDTYRIFGAAPKPIDPSIRVYNDTTARAKIYVQVKVGTYSVFNIKNFNNDKINFYTKFIDCGTGTTPSGVGTYSLMYSFN